MGLPRTRLDKVVELRDRAEDDAVAALARARSSVDGARAQLDGALSASRSDGRGAGPVELWVLDEHAHRRALQAVRAADAAVQEAVKREVTARDGWLAARQEADAARRARGRKVLELVAEEGRRERRDLDEVATLRFNAAR